MKLNIVTVALNANEELATTLTSSLILAKTLSFRQIVVVSNPVALDWKDWFFSSFDDCCLIENEDSGLYDAMNIGLSKCQRGMVWFVNGGDSIVIENVQAVKSALNGNVSCRCYRTLQHFRGRSWIRPGSNTPKGEKWLGHQGFLAPVGQRSEGDILFDTSRVIDADVYWMRDNIRAWGIVYSSDIIAEYGLGGLSSYPTLATVRLRFLSQGVFAAAKEIVKLCLRVVLGGAFYYALLASVAQYDVPEP